MSRSNRYSPELRERAMRMVMENRADYPSEWAAFTAISKLFGMSPETLRTWLRKTQIDADSRLGATSDDLVNRKFHRPHPNELWVTDITEHPTREGKVYCCAVLDAFSGKNYWLVNRYCSRLQPCS